VLAFKRGRFFYGGSGSGSGSGRGGGGDAAAGSCERFNNLQKRVETSGFFRARGGGSRRRHHHCGSTRWRTETFTSVVVSAPTSSASTTFSDANADTSPFCSISGFQTTETRDRRSSSRSSSSDSGSGGRHLKRGSAFMREGHGWVALDSGWAVRALERKSSRGDGRGRFLPLVSLFPGDVLCLLLSFCCEISLLFVDVPVSFSIRRSVVSPDFSPRTARGTISL
jgi:hypothetical protein